MDDIIEIKQITFHLIPSRAADCASRLLVAIRQLHFAVPLDFRTESGADLSQNNFQRFRHFDSKMRDFFR